MTGKERMLNAYHGRVNDRVAIAPEFWYYYPAKVLGVDMLEFQREVPFHQALKTTFETFDCEGWGIAFAGAPNPDITHTGRETWLDDNTLETRTEIRTPVGTLTQAYRYSRDEPAWCTERPVKDLARDLPAWEVITFGANPADLDLAPLLRAYEEVGETYLLEAWAGVPFFDTYAGGREGGFEAGIIDLMTPELHPHLQELREKHTDQLVATARVICEQTPVESLCLGCSWSCNSLLGPRLWREWDKPGIQALCEEVHRHGRLLHIHFHGACMETVADFAELGLDCVCPFERPPGGDVAGLDDLKTVARLLKNRTTMNGNVHTVETLIRGTEQDARREVCEILEAFEGNPRVIVGTGDQVGRETPEANLHAMIDEAKRLGKQAAAPAPVE